MAVAAILYLSVCMLVYFTQRKLIFLPTTTTAIPADANLSNVVEIRLNTSTGQAHTSWYQKAALGKPTLLFFHGNGGSLVHRGPFFREFDAIGYGVFAVGYPGYGGNPGKPSEAAFVDVAERAYTALLDLGVTPDDIVLYGESLGTAVAVQLAAKHTVAAIILEAPMRSVVDIAAAQYPFLPVRQLIKDPFRSYDYVGAVDAPLLIVHGNRDTLIPIASGKALFDAAREPKTFHTVDGASHALRANVMRPIVETFMDNTRGR